MLLIAGATGYIGGLLAGRLAEQGRDVRCLARDAEAAAGKLDDRCEIVPGDVLDPDAAAASLDEPNDRTRVAQWIRNFLKDESGENR